MYYYDPRHRDLYLSTANNIPPVGVELAEKAFIGANLMVKYI